jgi:hypothetical protein
MTKMLMTEKKILVKKAVMVAAAVMTGMMMERKLVLNMMTLP